MVFYFFFFIGDIGYIIFDGLIIVFNILFFNNKLVVWLVINGVFKVLVKLKVGENVI